MAMLVNEMENIVPAECKIYSCGQCRFSTRRLGSYERHTALHFTENGKRKIKPEKNNASSEEDEFLGSSGDEWNEPVVSGAPTSSDEASNHGSTSRPKFNLKRHRNSVSWNEKVNENVSKTNSRESGSSDEESNLGSTSTPKFFCKNCNFSSSYSSNLTRHRNTVHWYENVSKTNSRDPGSSDEEATSTPKFFCENCNFSSNYNYNLTRHRKSVHCNENVSKTNSRESGSIVQFNCERCPFVSRCSYSLRSHQNNEHSNDEINFVISDYQGSQTALSEESTKSAKETSQVRPIRFKVTVFSCDKCDFKTEQRKLFFAHKDEHSKTKTLRCEECCSSFSLKRNVQTLSNERSYKCPECDNSFNKSESLKDEAIIENNSDTAVANEQGTEQMNTTKLEPILSNKEGNDGRSVDVSGVVVSIHPNSKSVEVSEPISNSQNLLDTNSDIHHPCTKPLMISKVESISSNDDRSVAVGDDAQSIRRNVKPVEVPEPINNSQSSTYNSLEPLTIPKREPISSNEKENFTNSLKTTVFTCGQCDFKTEQRRKFIAHKDKHLNLTRPFKCRECEKSYTRSDYLKVHVRSAHWKAKAVGVLEPNSNLVDTVRKTYSCDQCSYVSRWRNNFKEHKVTHVQERNYLCDECGIHFKLPRYLFKHKRMCHLNERPFKCDKCHFFAKTTSSLKTHQRVHSDEKPYKCSHCKYACKHKTLLKRHERFHTGEKPYKCSECKFETHTRTRLLYHRVSHIGHKLYKCDQCSKSFMEKKRLEEHKLRHNQEKPFKCEKCDATFLTIRSYDGHLLTHTNEIPQYLCDHCGKAFYTKINLSSHVFRMHSELSKNRSFKCDVCEATFKLKNKLKEHKYSHTGEKPYKCGQCSYATRIASNFHKHKLIHTGNKPYKCDICDYCTGNRSNLTCHIKKMHDKFSDTKTTVKRKAAVTRRTGVSKKRNLKAQGDRSTKQIEPPDRVMRKRKPVVVREEPMDDDDSCDSPPDDDDDYSPPKEVDRIENEDSETEVMNLNNGTNNEKNGVFENNVELPFAESN